MERQTCLCLAVTNSVEAPHKVKMPCGSAELAVCDDMITSLFLLCNEIKDSLILYLFKLLGCDSAVFKICSCLFQIVRSEKAAHKIVPAWCFDIIAHFYYLFHFIIVYFLLVCWYLV